LTETDHFKVLGDDRIILKFIKKQDGVDWIDLAQDRDKWWAVVNTVIKVRVPQNEGNLRIK
jgi:hypothetical protein